MNYYNEHDKDMAEWLRELIKERQIPAGDVDATRLSRVQQGRSAFCRAMRGTSGREPKRSPATCCFGRFASARFAHAPACGRDLARDARRTTRISWARLDYAAETESGLSRAVVSPWSFVDTQTHALDSACATRGQFSQPAPFGILRSTSFSDSELEERETPFRKHSRLSVRQSPWGLFSTGMQRRKPASKTCWFYDGIDRGFCSVGIAWFPRKQNANY